MWGHKSENAEESHLLKLNDYYWRAAISCAPHLRNVRVSYDYIDGNGAVASVAFRTSEVIAITLLPPVPRWQNRLMHGPETVEKRLGRHTTRG